MANRFLKVDYDKFANKTTTSMKDEYKVRAYNINLKAKLRHVSMPDFDSLVLDLHYDGLDWFFLRDGKLTININNVENIVLEPHESWTNTYTGWDEECHCEESDYYELDQELLKKICDAKTLEFKIEGGDIYDLADGIEFIKYAQKFYNGFYDDEAYKDVVEESTSSETGCMVTLLMAISALSSLTICASLLIGLF